MAKCQLQLIRSYPYDISTQTNIMALNYTCFTDSRSAACLEIVSHGFRYLQASQKTKIIMIVVDQKLEQTQNEIIVRVPFTIYQFFMHADHKQIVITRKPIGLISPFLPKLEATKEINVYFNSNFRIDQAIVQLLSSCDFVCQTGDYFIDCQWMQSVLTKFGSIRCKLDWQHAISERGNGRYVSYLKVFVQMGEKTSEPRLFRKGETKLSLKQEFLHPYNLYRWITLDRLQVMLFGQAQYQSAFAQLASNHIQNEIVVVETEKHIGLQEFMHYYSQTVLKCGFKCIDCQNLSSTKQFWNELQSIFILQNSIVLIKNIAWVEELYQAEQILNFDVKAIIKKLQQEFKRLCNASLNKFSLVFEQIGQKSIYEHFQTARNVTLKLPKTKKLQIFASVLNYQAGQHAFKQQIAHQFHDKFGWQVLREFMRNSWSEVKGLPLAQIFKKMRDLVKQEQVENLIEVSWDDVGGLETAKQEIIQTVLLPIKHPQIFDQWIKPRTGLLFYGPPGTGKTLLGKCVAKECKMSFISVKGPQLLNMYVGQSEKNVRGVFERARACSPCIVFMDELDALVPKRGNSGDSNQVMDRIVAELLQQMDTAAASQVFVIGATNRPDLLDPSILRPGRFDKQIYLGITQASQDRIKIIKAQTRHLTLAQQLNWQRVLDWVPKNFTGADFYGLTSKAVMAAAERTIDQYEKGFSCEKIIISQEDFISAASGIKSSVTEADLSRYEQLRKIYS